MKILLAQLDGKLPNLALMRIAAHHRALGDSLELRHGAAFEKTVWDSFDKVYASALFTKSTPLIERLQQIYPGAVIGGTGYDLTTDLAGCGITTLDLDYSLYPSFPQSIGFTQRGCRLKCSFCVVPRKEGGVREEQTVQEIWRGDPWPKQIVLLDNDFFGQARWRGRINEIVSGGFKVSFTQGINCRCLTDEAAEAIAAVDYRNDSMTVRRLYTAWDSLGDEQQLFTGLSRLVRYGVKPHHIMVYMLIGYWPNETHDSRDLRRQKLRDFGCVPYPMPFVRTPELVGYQRWVIGAYDKRISWQDWSENKFRPEGLRAPEDFAAWGTLVA